MQEKYINNKCIWGGNYKKLVIGDVMIKDNKKIVINTYEKKS